MGEELLSWLWPDASEAERTVARRVITALRLLRDDGRLREARRAAPSAARARAELELLARRRRRRALETLLGQHLSAFRSPDSFLELGAETRDSAAAWRELVGAPGASALPAPGESPPALVARWIAAGAAEGAPLPWRSHWEGCARHVFGTSAEAERGWQRAFAHALEARARPPLLARLLAGLVAARLDRFHPAEAFELGARHAPLVALDPGLRRLLGWSALFAGELARARELLRGVGAAPLPRPVAELRAAHPSWAAWLPGPARASGVRPRAAPSTRRGFGALLLALFACPGGRAELVRLDACRSVRLAARRRAAELAPPEELVAGRAFARGLACARPEPLGAARTHGLVCAAVRGAGGALAGWIQLESEHELLPSEAQLARLARTWRARILARFASAAGPSLRVLSSGVRSLAGDDPRREFLAALTPLLGPLACRRAFWLEDDGSGALEVVAERGGALADWRKRGGGAGLVLCAAAQRASVRHTGEREAALHRRARAGLAVPLCALGSGRLLGLLALESSARDPVADPFGSDFEETLRAGLAQRELAWWCAAFRAQERRASGAEFAWAPDGRFLAALESTVRAAMQNDVWLVIEGPEGSGRRTLARWLAFRGLRIGVVPGAIPVRVPPLFERRDELPVLVQALARTAARRAGHAPVHFDDEALAALWRQDWPGHVDELAEVVGALARAHAGSRVDVSAVRAVFLARGAALRERLPIRRPSAQDVADALLVTRHRNGGVNRARAARYLGWSPETLGARLGDDAPVEP